MTLPVKLRNYRLFNFGRSCHLDVTPVVADDDFNKHVAWWLNGRIFGWYVDFSWKPLR